MSDLQNLISSYKEAFSGDRFNGPEFSAALKSSQYHLSVRWTEYLFRVHYTDDSDMDLKECRQATGTVFDRNTFEIVAYTFEKMDETDLEDFWKGRSGDQPVTDMYNVCELVDGTMIKCYWHDSALYVSTAKEINAYHAKFGGRNFMDMFVEACEQLGIDLHSQLSPGYTYTFVLQHPDNRIVVKYSVPSLVHVGTTNMQTLKQEPNAFVLGVPKPTQYSTFAKSLGLSANIPGFVLADKTTGRMTKVNNPMFTRVHAVKGNYTSPVHRAIDMWVFDEPQEVYSEYMEYFPEHRETFHSTFSEMNELLETVHTTFVDSVICKKYRLVHTDYLYRVVMDLVRAYKETGQATTKQSVKDIFRLHTVGYIHSLLKITSAKKQGLLQTLGVSE